MKELKNTTVKANGLDFSLIEEGVGPLILCLHGFPDNALTFYQQIKFLSKNGYRAVAPYMRGYSPTAVPEKGSYQAATLGQDVITLIDALGYESAIVLGHDWGALAAYASAIMAPEKIEQLITVSVPYGQAFKQSLVINPLQQRRSWYIFYFQTILAKPGLEFNDFAFIENLWRDWSSPDWEIPKENIDSVKETFKAPGVADASLEYYRQVFDTSSHVPDLAEIQQSIGVKEIKVPALYIHGQKDGCIGAELCEGMEKLFTNGLKKEIFSDAGHFVHLEKPEKFNEIVLECVKG